MTIQQEHSKHDMMNDFLCFRWNVWRRGLPGGGDVPMGSDVPMAGDVLRGGDVPGGGDVPRGGGGDALRGGEGDVPSGGDWGDIPGGEGDVPRGGGGDVPSGGDWGDIPGGGDWGDEGGEGRGLPLTTELGRSAWLGTPPASTSRRSSLVEKKKEVHIPFFWGGERECVGGDELVGESRYYFTSLGGKRCC